MAQENIESLLEENRVFEPPKSQASFSSLNDWQVASDAFQTDFEGSWKHLAEQHLTWQKPFTQVLDASNPPFYRWFADGNVNLSENCLDRHVQHGLGERTA
ncbi:MAG: acetyl-coenzyme A synthetase N-terminal domain-containing protein, partial [Mariprofundaceae bacterium]|nr:acetyl-coenzyme A synthetase N-terminal domain-containing protein [Mariprofundaceae bacterium]